MIVFRIIHHTVIFQFAKELNPKQPIQGHEEKEEQCHIVDLLARTSVKNN